MKHGTTGNPLAPIAGLTIAIFAAMALFACVSDSGAKAVKAPETKTDAVTAATAETENGWTVEVSGVRKAEWKQSYWDAALSAKTGLLHKIVDKKGQKVEADGIPLSALVAMVDGDDERPPFTFDAAKWASGYDITLTAKDGYSATFNTKDVKPDALVVSAADASGPTALPYTIGDTAKNLWVKDLVSVKTGLSGPMADPKAAAFRLELDVNGKAVSYSIKELETLPYYLEGKGAYTTSAGTKYEAVWAGVSLRSILESGSVLGPDDSVTFTATDGYEMSYSGAQILDESDGTWIIASKMDGAYLPSDPGYLRTIKVGPKNPNIDGHLSVRMIGKISLKQKAFRAFTLSLKGKTDTVMDASTVMSCASCHKTSVAFEKKGEKAQYSGFPLWLLMAYADDGMMPHKQDKSIAVYDEKAAIKGYQVTLSAKDGFKVTLDSKELNRNDKVIVAVSKDGTPLPDAEAPLVLVWDTAASPIPAGIKNVKGLADINLSF